MGLLSDKIAGLSGPALKDPFADQTAALAGLGNQVGNFNVTVAPGCPDAAEVQAKIDDVLLPLQTQLSGKIGLVGTTMTTHGAARVNAMLTDLPLMSAVASARDYVAQVDGLAAQVLDGNACAPDLGGAFQSFSESALAEYDAVMSEAAAVLNGAIDGALDMAGVDDLIAVLTEAQAQIGALEDQLQAYVAEELGVVSEALTYIRSLAFVRWLEEKADDPCVRYLAGKMTDGIVVDL